KDRRTGEAPNDIEVPFPAYHDNAAPKLSAALAPGPEQSAHVVVLLYNDFGAPTYRITKSCQDAPLLAVGRNGILVRGFGGQIPEIMPGCPTACGGEEWHPC